jgi:hypothetical protein
VPSENGRTGVPAVDDCQMIINTNKQVSWITSIIRASRTIKWEVEGYQGHKQNGVLSGVSSING